VGQFCTNPGIAIVTQDQADSIVAAAGGSLRVVTPLVTLTADLATAYGTGSQHIARGQSVRGIVASNGSQREASPFLFTVSGSDVLVAPELAEKVFGSLVLLVTVHDQTQMIEIAKRLQGQLPATLHLALAIPI
jgi:alpha-ketoglutaric semialdehyde dehydrogenase